MCDPTIVLLQGFLTALALITAIGPQNTFTLRQAILKNYRLLTALIFVFCDSILFFVGIEGVGALVATSPIFLNLLKWVGGAFILYMAGKAFLNALRGPKAGGVDLGALRRPNLRSTVLTGLAYSFLNPHAYLDAFVVIGNMGAQYGSYSHYFAFGTIIGSAVWFAFLTLFGSMIAPAFKKPQAWVVLDLFTGCILLWVAYAILLGGSFCG